MVVNVLRAQKWQININYETKTACVHYHGETKRFFLPFVQQFNSMIFPDDSFSSFSSIAFLVCHYYWYVLEISPHRYGSSSIRSISILRELLGRHRWPLLDTHQKWFTFKMTSNKIETHLYELKNLIHLVYEIIKSAYMYNFMGSA